MVFEKYAKKTFSEKTRLPEKPEYPDNREISEKLNSLQVHVKKIDFLTHEDLSCPEAYIKKEKQPPLTIGPPFMSNIRNGLQVRDLINALSGVQQVLFELFSDLARLVAPGCLHLTYAHQQTSILRL